MNGESEHFMQSNIASQSFDNSRYSSNYPCDYFKSDTSINIQNQSEKVLQNGSFHETTPINTAIDGGSQYYRAVENMPPEVLPVQIKEEPTDYSTTFIQLTTPKELAESNLNYHSNYTQFNHNEQEDSPLVNYFTKASNSDLYTNGNQKDSSYSCFSEDGIADISYSQESEHSIKVEPPELDEDMPMDKSLVYSFEQNIKTPAKRGRPLKDGPPRPPRSHKKKKIQDGEPVSKLPRMSSRLDQKTLNKDMIVLYKANREAFLQNGLCYMIAPFLDFCLECKTKSRRRRGVRKTVDCRFYEFRKLVYTESGELKVFGFLDPYVDPKGVDQFIWLPDERKQEERAMREKKLTTQQARLILTHVGAEFCNLIKNEQSYFREFKQEDKNMIWKRLIQGVREICDICSTSLFNYHFICNKCGFTCCVDCYKEHRRDGNDFEFACSRKPHKTHSLPNMKFTQMMIGDALNVMHLKYHDSCVLWNLEHCSEIIEVALEVDPIKRNIAKNIMSEQLKDKSFLEQIPESIVISELDLDQLKLLSVKEEREGSINEDKAINLSANSKHVNKKEYAPDFELPVTSKIGGQNFVLDSCRIFSKELSQRIYNDVPHDWLCGGKLLRLIEPSNDKNYEIFHDQWQRGQPVIVSNVLTKLNRDLWNPQSFSRDFGDQTTDLINCLNSNLVSDQPMAVFWDGFEIIERRLKDKDGTPMLLKLKDWPPDEDFAKLMPNHFEDLMKNLPLAHYTRRTGKLNLVRHLPSCFVVPDLGPKMYNAYGSPFYLSNGTTNLHLDVSDAANVIVYVGVPKDVDNLDEYTKKTFEAILEADCDSISRDRVLKSGDIPGAIWHIFEAADSNKIREFLMKVAQEQGKMIQSQHDPIHDQNWYLDGKLRKRLYVEHGVKGYAIVQCLGDAIFVPAGTPHQVRNIYSCIKVAEDFVSPENISHCLHLSNEFRKLTKTHTNNEDKLQIKNIIYHSVKEVVLLLEQEIDKVMKHSVNNK